jgi:transposase InsO family protein
LAGPERRRSRSEGPANPPSPVAGGPTPAALPEANAGGSEGPNPSPPADAVKAALISAARQLAEAEDEEGDLAESTGATPSGVAPPATVDRQRPRLGGRRVGGPARLAPPLPPTPVPPALTPEQRLLLLDTWRRSGLPAGDFASLVGVSKHTLYSWKKRFEEEGPAGLLDQPRAQKHPHRLPELTRRTILMLKESNPEWGCQRISDMLLRGPALPASPTTVARVLHEAGYELEEVPTRPHEAPVQRFERARPNQLWQTDLFSFLLKRQNRRVYLVAFLDDHSRFVVGYGLHASQSAALVLEVLRASLSAYGAPEEILTDNGSQYVTWRGKSAFAKELEKRGIRQVVATPRRPQTLGKIERFWGTLWRECVEAAVFVDLEDARRRIGLFIDSYNFQRPHQGIDGLTPADRYFGAAQEVKQTLAARVAANALELARQGLPKAPFYLTGQVGGQGFSVHAEGERVFLTGAAGERREVELTPPPAGTATSTWPEPVCPGATMATFTGEGMEQPGMPGTSPLDEGLQRLHTAWPRRQGGEA